MIVLHHPTATRIFLAISWMITFPCRLLTCTPAGLDWWQQRDHRFPYLNKMAQQYLACPATSAGVEHLFSAAGLTFSDLAQAMKEGTLRARLIAGYNYNPHMYVAP